MANNLYFEKVRPRLAEIESWLKNGLDQKQVFNNLGVSKTSWETYKHKYPELSELIKKGTESPIKEVENSLFKNATGFYYYVDELIKLKDSEGNEFVEKVSVKKFKAPETAAIAFYLKNKLKKEYADNPGLLDIRREELELRRKESEFKNF